LKKIAWLLPLAALAVLGWWAVRRNHGAPQVPFAKVVRQTLVSSLPTNGKVEPIKWQAVRAEQAGLVTEVPVHEGQTVSQGATLAVLSDTGLRADLEAAQASLAQARAHLAVIEAGGPALERTSIENDLARLRVERDRDQKNYDSLHRLAEKEAASLVEVEAMKSKLQAAELAIEALKKRRAALVTESDKTVAEARLRDAQAAVALARTHLAQTVIHAPIAGMLYGLAARPGSYLETGDLVANVGQTDRLRVKVYVDEPELGRVAEGQPVTITWDALPGRSWSGTVERRPADIMPLNTRQVGEVLCTIENPGHVLLPGTNIDAHILTATVANALTMPKECLRRNASGIGVFVLHGDRLAWQPVTTGVASVNRVQIVQGPKEGDAVALPTDLALRAGEVVRPLWQ